MQYSWFMKETIKENFKNIKPKLIIGLKILLTLVIGLILSIILYNIIF